MENINFQLEEKGIRALGACLATFLCVVYVAGYPAQIAIIGTIIVIFSGIAAILCVADYIRIRRVKREAEANLIVLRLKGIDLKRHNTL